MAATLKKALLSALDTVSGMDAETLIERRYQRFASYGEFKE